MKNFVVLYRVKGHAPLDAPYQFHCQADDGDHAEEQCENAYPGCDVVWVFEGDDCDAALNEYWSDDRD